jgi:hypothetical protein
MMASGDISPQGNAATTAQRNLLYSGPTTAPTRLIASFPLDIEKIVLTGSDGIGKPLTQVLTGRLKSGKRTRTIEGASTIVLTFSDADRGVLNAPVLYTGLPSISSVATALLNDINTLGLIKISGQTVSKGQTYAEQVPGGSAAQGQQSDEVSRNKALVVQIGVNRGLPREAVVIAMMTMLDESGGVNVLTPDSNGSSGIMQQTPSQGWGTREQVNDPVYAINKFYDSLLGVSGWQNMSPWVAAQSVQRSAWTGHPNSNNNYSSELGGNYHAKYDEALQAVQGYRPLKSPDLNKQVQNNAQGIVSVSRKASAKITYQDIDYVLVRVATAGSDTVLTFEDAQINKLRRNKDPYSSGKPTSIPLFVTQLLRNDGINPHFVQQGEVISRVDPTGALNAGQSDPATLANFDQLLATDGARGTGTLRVLTKFASATTTSAVKNAQGYYDQASVDGVVQDSWATITGLVLPLRWIAMSDGQDIYVGSEEYVSHYINKPPLLLQENADGIEWLSGEFDLGTSTSNELTFPVTAQFVGVPAQRCVINNMGLLSGIWMIYSIEDTLGSAQSQVTLQRIQADLEDAEHQDATNKLLTGGGGVSTTDSGVLGGARPAITGQVSQNGWASGDAKRANLGVFTVPGTSVQLTLNRQCATLLLYVAKQFNDHIEPLHAGECFGYDPRTIRGNAAVWSNHSSGTAIDLNAPAHPLASEPSSTFSPAQIDMIHSILSGLRGTVRWGGDYKGRKDSMHFEINTDATGVGVISAQIDPTYNVGQGQTTGGH